jgi:hypothetical protein
VKTQSPLFPQGLFYFKNNLVDYGIRIMFVSMKRNTHSYKCEDSVYNKAKRVAKKEGTNVANVIEDFLKLFGKGDFGYWKPVPESESLITNNKNK